MPAPLPDGFAQKPPANTPPSPPPAAPARKAPVRNQPPVAAQKPPAGPPAATPQAPTTPPVAARQPNTGPTATAAQAAPPKSPGAVSSPPPEPKPVAAPQEVPGLSFAHLIQPVGTAGMPNSMAFMGPYKAGKTTLLASCAEVATLTANGKQVLILEAETGTASIAEDYPDVQQFAISTALGFDRAVDELISRPHNFSVVGIDTFDKFQEMRVNYELALTPNDTRAAYGRVKKWTTEMAWKLHKAGFFAVFLFHEDDEKNESTGKVKTTYSLVGGAKKDLGQVFDLIGRLGVVTNKDGSAVRVLQLAQGEQYVTGSRWEKKLPPTMENPTMAKIFDIIEAKSAPAGDDTLTKE